MPVIEGIGDEVVQFFSVVLVTVVAVTAWWSTSIRESHHNIRTVLILERRSRNRTGGDATQPPVVVRPTDTDNSIDTGQPVNSDGGDTTELLTDNSQNKDDTEASNTTVVEEEAAGDCVTRQLSEEGSQAQDTQGSGAEQNITVNKRLVPLLKESSTILRDAPQERVTDENQMSTEGDQITIRLKYLNDDQKLVEGRLQEPLGEFKRRHFNMELSTDKLVRLIFNGQVLGSDQQTLEACGLYDNCVVHCLVHNQRTQSQTSSTPHATPTTPNPPDWNLTTLLYTCVSVILCIVWYCRYQYAQLFTLTTTAALIGLTGIFSVSVFSLYLPDQDGIPH